MSWDSSPKSLVVRTADMLGMVLVDLFAVVHRKLMKFIVLRRS